MILFTSRLETVRNPDRHPMVYHGVSPETSLRAQQNINLKGLSEHSYRCPICVRSRRPLPETRNMTCVVVASTSGFLIETG